MARGATRSRRLDARQQAELLAEVNRVELDQLGPLTDRFEAGVVMAVRGRPLVRANGGSPVTGPRGPGRCADADRGAPTRRLRCGRVERSIYGWAEWPRKFGRYG